MYKNKYETTTSLHHVGNSTPQERQQFVESYLKMMVRSLVSFDAIETPMLISEFKEALTFSCLQQLDNQFLIVDQILTEFQMQAVCGELQENAQQGNAGYIEINFTDFTQQCGGDTFYFGDAIFGLKVLGTDEAFFVSLHESCRMDTRVHIGKYNGATRAFLEATWDDGEYLIVELSEVHMLSTFTVKDGNFGLMTIFSDELGIMAFDVLAASLREKYPKRTDIPAGSKAPRNRGDHIFTHDEEY